MSVRIPDPEWASITDRLTLKAAYLVRTKKWQGVPGGSPPGGAEAKDYVKAAIMAYLGLEIDLNFSSKQEVYQWLSNHVIRSISNHSRSIENKKNFPIDYHENDDFFDSDRFFGQNVVGFHERTRNPEEDIIRKRERDSILKILEDDPICQKVALLIVDYKMSKPQQLSEYLGIPIKSVYNIKRKLFDRIKKIHAKRDIKVGDES